MVDVEALVKEIDDSHISKTGIAKKLGYSCRGTLYNKLENPDTITVDDIEGFTKILHLTEKKRNLIFFAK